MLKTKLRKGDTVIVSTGKYKGSKGKILKVFPSKDKLLIENVGIVKKHHKAKSQEDKSRIISKESPIAISNVQYFDEKSSKGVKIGYKLENSGAKVRYNKVTGEIIG